MHSKASAEDVDVWVYHNFPPYVVDGDSREGLSFDLADKLTEMSGGAYTFNVLVMPRERLNARMDAGQSGIVLWANPAWFGDQNKTRFHWTAPVISDRNDVISPVEVSFRYTGAESLRGTTLVGISGHRYPGVDDMIDNGDLERVDVSSEDALVRFVASGRGSVAIVAHSAATYYVRSLGLLDEVHFSDKPHSRYQRYILVPSDMDDLATFLQSSIAELNSQEAWKETVLSYGVNEDLLP